MNTNPILKANSLKTKFIKMKIMKYFFYSLLFFKLLINSSYCDTCDTLKYDWPHEVSDLKPDPRIVYGKLDNGFRYVFMPNAQLPKHFSVRLYVDAGSLMEEKHEQGLAHFLEHMAFKGIRGYPEDQMIQTLQHLGVSFGSHTNAYTSFDETVYMLDFMDNSAENLQHALKIMAGIADGIVLDETLIKKEIGVILAEKRDSSDVGYKLYCDYSQFFYSGTLINERMPIGLESVIKSANTKLLRNFYKTWYRPERMILFVVGDLNQKEVETKINEYFSTFKDLLKPSEDPNMGNLKYKQGLKTRVYKDKELQDIHLELTSLKPYQQKIGDKKVRKEKIYESLAYKIFNERIEDLARQEAFPFLDGYCRTDVNYNHFTQSRIGITCKPEQVFEAINAAENELRRIFEYGFTDAEFDRIKRDTLYQYEKDLALDETQETTELIYKLLEGTKNKKVFTSNQWDYNFLKEFFETEANKETCLEIFKNSWDMENILIYLSTNSGIPYTADQLKEAYFTSQTIPLEAPKERETIKYSYTGLGEKGTIIDESYNKELDYFQYRFSNNVRVNLKQTKFDKDEIFYQINFGNGKDEPVKKLPGITSAAISVLHNGGIGQLTEEELSKAFAGSGVKIPLIIPNKDSFWIYSSSSIKPTDFESQMNLICGSLMEPAYRSDQLKQAHANSQNFYNNLNQTIEGTLILEVEPYLTHDHPDYKLDPVEDVIARTPEEVKAWMHNALTESYIEISVVGDFDKDQILESLLKTLGALPKRKDNKQCYETQYEVHLQESPTKRIFPYYSMLPLASSLVYWELPSQTHENDHLSMINNVRAKALCQILNERLRQKVRMELGEGYSPYSHVPFDGKAIMVTTLTDPEKANLLCELIVQIGETLALEGATEDEFNRVILAKLLDIESEKFTNQYWLHRLVQSQEYSYKTKNRNFIDNCYKNLKLEDINEAAKEYLQSNKALKIMIVPESYPIL